MEGLAAYGQEPCALQQHPTQSCCYVSENGGHCNTCSLSLCFYCAPLRSLYAILHELTGSVFLVVYSTGPHV